MKTIRLPQIVLLPIQFLFTAHSVQYVSNALVITNGKCHHDRVYKSSQLGTATRLFQTTEKNEIDAGNQDANNLNNGVAKVTERQQQPPLRRSRSANASAREMMAAMGTSPRRIFLSFTSSAGIALVGNLFGVTSSVLNYIDEDVVELTGLDTYYPRGDFKRHISADYTFVIPKEWVADTAVELAKAQRMTQPLDYKMRQTSGGILPDAGKFQFISVFP